uniref:G-protein coupled receptors family 1 profile domain-containing protein n=1 Tax=Branchiostoma floridae TaxID=7739 RepID=C3YNJ8_BRAFL|eukprot:XP_002602292.1 hypothetical protein BRAFLDRAFT_76984 [Branchiostoma floridae]
MTTVTVVGGLLTILAICTRPALRKLVNVPLVSLSCADILFASLYSPFWIQQILHPQWEPPGALCWFLAYASPVLWGVSLSHMLCIALQRYFKICTDSTRLNSTRALVIMLLLTWLVPIVSFLPLHVGEEVKVDPKMKFCSMGDSDKLWAKIPPVILTLILPYIAALSLYVLIQNHVRKSKKRVQANAQGPSASLGVQHTRWEGDGAGPSTSTGKGKVAKPVKNLEGVVWVGGETSSSSDGGLESGKPKGTIILVASASGTDRQQHGEKSQLDDDGEKGNDRIEPYKAQDMTHTVATVSDQTGKTVPGTSAQNSTSAAERQITKMMMVLFAVYTLCNMPLILMVIFSSKVPVEALTVGQLVGLFNGALNPIMYGVMNKNIRQGYKHIWDRVLNFITKEKDVVEEKPKSKDANVA